MTETLKEIYESRNDYLNALNVIYNVPIETFDVFEMDIVHYQLEILRLATKNKDWTKCEIISKKIRMSYFKDTTDVDGEIKYYTQMVDYAIGQKLFGDAGSYFKKLYELDKSTRNILFCSFFTVLSEEDKKRNEMLDFCFESEDNTDPMRKIIKLFLSKEIIPRNIGFNIDEYLNEFNSDFLRAVDFHNFKIVSLFFECVSFDDLSNILQCSVDECINLICESVGKGMKVVINQNNGIVTFKKKNEDDVEEKIDNVMEKINKVYMMIQRENNK